MNYGSVVGLPAIANGVAVPLCNPAATSCALGDLRLQADTNATNILGDVVGYFGRATGAAPPCFETNNRYVDCGNGTVTDTVTGLVWLKNANCFGIQNYKVANEKALALATGQCGLTDGSSAGDWRLPTKSEWETTVARAAALGCNSPGLTNIWGTVCASTFGTPFTSVDDFYWTANAWDQNPDNAWCITLSNSGTMSPFCGKAAIATTIFVWPVRSGR